MFSLTEKFLIALISSIVILFIAWLFYYTPKMFYCSEAYKNNKKIANLLKNQSYCKKIYHNWIDSENEIKRKENKQKLLD